mmetsp:Transcript_350/g.510  ORF Transcript_350/g.510 Transcript_350/m.510 type:complete len:104 (-) Transcript_350:140-451(-)
MLLHLVVHSLCLHLLEYAQHPQNYSGAGLYDRQPYPRPHEDDEHSRMANEHYRHGHPSHDYQPPAYGDGGNYNESKPPAVSASDQNEAQHHIHHDEQTIDERK